MTFMKGFRITSDSMVTGTVSDCHGKLVATIFQTTKAMCEHRLRGLLRRLHKEPDVLYEYDRIMKEQLEQGIMERVDKEGDLIHYLPHHPAVRKEAETTKLRVVYDASAKSRKGDRSLNECLHTGPPLTLLLFDILLRLRTYPIMLIADMKKAFLQIEVDERDRDCLRLLWAKNPLAEVMEVWRIPVHKGDFWSWTKSLPLEWNSETSLDAVQCARS